ncbi:MAG: CPBP family intramembrane metalloprotease [Lachnospiraceae bacterium]|nr:CPBP family intramembrane metalloprotease [Lachnospiraceae bacterium]
MNHKKTFSKIGLILFIGTILNIMIRRLAGYLSMFVTYSIPSGDFHFLVQMLSMYFVTFPIIFFLFKAVPTQPVIEQKKMKISHLITTILISYATTFLLNLLGTLIIGAIGMMMSNEVEHVMMTITGSISPFTNFLIIVICAPIMEELLFRKAIISRVSHYGEKIAILFSATLFGLFHGNLLQFGYAFVLGLFFGFIFVKTGRLLYTILLHMSVNFLGSFIGPIILEKTGALEFLNKFNELSGNETFYSELMDITMEHMNGLLLLGLYEIFLLVMVITGLVLLIKSRKKFICNPGEITIEKGKRFTTMFINLGAILFCGFWLAQMVLQLFG